MLGVGGQALESVGDELPERADVLVFGGEHSHCLGLLLPVALAVPQGGLGQGGGVAQLGQQRTLGVQGGADAGGDALLVKVGVGDGGEEVEGDEMVDLGGNGLALCAQGGGDGGDPLTHIHQQILHGGHIALLAAHPHPGAAAATGGLLTLITKHAVFHGS